MLLKKFSIPFFMAVISGVVVLTSLRIAYSRNLSYKGFERQPSQFNSLPPQDSLAGVISALAGGVTKFDRLTNRSIPAEQHSYVLEGESVSTDATGSAQINFSTNNTIFLGLSTKLSLIDAKTSHLLVVQQSGDATYTAKSEVPFSIRSLSLLTTVATGSAQIKINDTSSKVEIVVVSGEVVIAYQDMEKNTHIKSLVAPDQRTYNHKKRTLLPE